MEQTHAPFNRYGFYSAEEFPERFRRLFVASRILGAKAVVVHADEYRPIGRYDVREALTFTYEFLAPYVEYAAKHDLIVAVENLCEDFYPAYPQIDGKSRFTSRLEELLGVIERFHSPAVGCCWDFGHANLAFGREGMGAALAQALPMYVARMCMTTIRAAICTCRRFLAKSTGHAKWRYSSRAVTLASSLLKWSMAFFQKRCCPCGCKTCAPRAKRSRPCLQAHKFYMTPQEQIQTNAGVWRMANTEEIYRHIVAEERYDEAFVLRNPAPSLGEYLAGQLQARGITKAALIRALCVERVYGYQLLNGTRRMSRTHLIRTALFLRMDIEETERLLRLGGEARLYARDRTDARVIFAIEKKLPFRQAWLFIWPEELD